ncbi:MAG: hypothetical protein ACOC53_05790 [Candidatus Saliniplasma sp.]
MEKVHVRFPPEDLRRIEKEVKYPNKSEAIRDKARKSYILEAIVHMREAAEDLDEELKNLENTREKKYDEYKNSSHRHFDLDHIDFNNSSNTFHK